MSGIQVEINNVNTSDTTSLEIAKVYADQNNVLKSYIQQKFSGRVNFLQDESDAMKRFKLPGKGEQVITVGEDGYQQLNMDLKAVIMAFKSKYNKHISMFNNSEETTIKLKSLGVALSYYYYIKLFMLDMIHLQTLMIGATVSKYDESCKSSSAETQELKAKITQLISENDSVKEQLDLLEQEKLKLQGQVEQLEQQKQQETRSKSDQEIIDMTNKEFWRKSFQNMEKAANKTMEGLDTCENKLIKILEEVSLANSGTVEQTIVDGFKGSVPSPSSPDNITAYENFKKSNTENKNVYKVASDIGVQGITKTSSVLRKIDMLHEHLKKQMETNVKLVQLIKDSLPLLAEFSLGDI